MMRELRHYILTCNYSDLAAGMCKALLQLDAPDETQARKQAREAGWDAEHDRCAAHKSRPEHGCPKDGTRLTVQGGIRRCHTGEHGYLRGELVVLS